ncbi:MAG: AtpZ/AtpI family protein [Pseudomonadota bacterium]
MPHHQGIAMPKDKETPTDPEGSQGADDDQLASRLDALDRDLGAQASGSGKNRANANAPSTGYGQALRMSTDFVAGVGVGAALGWGIDAVLGTSPWGLIVFLLLGFAAGILNVLRTAGLVAEAGTRETPSQERRPPSRRHDR